MNFERRGLQGSVAESAPRVVEHSDSFVQYKEQFGHTAFYMQLEALSPDVVEAFIYDVEMEGDLISVFMNEVAVDVEADLLLDLKEFSGAESAVRKNIVKKMLTKVG